MTINLNPHLGLAKDALSTSRDTKALERFDRGTHDRAEIKRVAEEFESLFLNIVMKSMRDSVQKSGLIDGGNAEDIYTGMLDDEYTKIMASQRSTGLADSIEESLLRAYGDQPAAPASKSAGLKAYQAQGLHSGAKQVTMKDDIAPSPLLPTTPAPTSHDPETTRKR